MRLAAIAIFVTGMIPPVLAGDPEICRLTVEVVQENGSPAPRGLRVSVRGVGQPIKTRTDGGAEPFLFERLPCATAYVYADGFPGQMRRGQVDLEPGAANTVTLTVPDLREVSVRVVDPRGNPVRVGDCLVREIRPSTDAAFRAGRGCGGSVPRATIVSRHPHRVEFRPAHKVTHAWIDGRPTTLPVLVETGREPVNVVLQVEPHRVVRGQVVDAAGAPLRSVRVRSDGEYRDSGRDGRFAIAVRESARALRFSRHGWRFEPEFVQIGQSDEVPTTVGTPIPRGDLLRGSVVDAANGEPVAGVRIDVYTSCPDPRPRTGRSTSEGSFAVACPADCAFRLEVGGVFDIYLPWRIDLPPGSCSLDLRIPLERGPTLTVRITDAAGRPVAYLPTHVYTQALQTREEGVVRRTGVPPGDYPIFASMNSRLPEHRELALVRAGHDSGFPVATVEDQDVELQLVARPGGQICARATDLSGNAVALRKMTVHRTTDRLELQRFRISERLRDDPAKICTGPLPPDRYLVQLHDAGNVTWFTNGDRSADPAAVEVEAGKIAEIDPVILSSPPRR